ncbi:MAG: PQQ-binding-like beta-propeller repeat protein [Dehalococcoidia bacterium]
MRTALFTRTRCLLLLLLAGALMGGCAKPAHTAKQPPTAPVPLAARSVGLPGQSKPQVNQSSATTDWPLFDHDPARSGVNQNETVLTPAGVGRLQRLWTQSLPDKADSSPILLSSVPLPDGSTADLLFLTTESGTTVALDAQSGAIVWQQQAAGPRIKNQRCQVCATLAADPSRRWIYAAGNDGAVHRYDVAIGAEDTASPWPVLVTLIDPYEKRSGSLNIANGNLYVPLSGYFGDFGPYVGHVVSIRLADGATQVFNVLCSDQHQLLAPIYLVPNSATACAKREAGVWARSGVVVDQSGGPADGQLFLATGNGPFDVDQGGTDYGDSVLRLSGDAATLIDSYTPSTFATLDQRDADLGSTAPALLPVQSGSSTPYLFVQGGKDAILRLVDRSHLGGVGGELQQLDVKAGGIFTAPIAWQDPQGSDASGNNTWLFVVTANTTVGLRVVTDASGKTTLQEGWRVSGGGTSPVIAGAILFNAGSGGVVARDPRTGKELWNSGQPSTGGNIGGIHWESPIVANGRLYISDESNKVTAYGLPGQ